MLLMVVPVLSLLSFWSLWGRERYYRATPHRSLSACTLILKAKIIGGVMHADTKCGVLIHSQDEPGRKFKKGIKHVGLHRVLVLAMVCYYKVVGGEGSFFSHHVVLVSPSPHSSS